MFAARRVATIGVCAAIVWYVVVLVLWALQPLSDSVPVGIDYTKTPPAPASVKVDCQTLFDSAALGDQPVPLMKQQPPTSPPLKFQREPCALVQRQARIVFALDTAAFVAVLVGFGWLTLSRRRSFPVDEL